MLRPDVVALRIVACFTCTCASWQSRSASSPGSVWYQTTETFPALPATSHGQKARAFDGLEIVTGAAHVLPQSVDHVSRTSFGAGVGLPSQPPVVPFWRSSGVQTV